MPDLVSTLRAENETLREKVRQLEAALAPEYHPPAEWCLTATEAKTFSALLTKDIATKSHIMLCLYTGMADDADIKIVDVMICKLRKKLRPYGIEIKTVWGVGYSLVNRESFRRAA